MIENLMSKCRNTEVADTATLVGQVYENKIIEGDPYLKGVMADLAAVNQQLLEVANRDKAESNLAELDETCDNKVQAFSYILQGALHHPASEVKTAAQRLRSIFDNYGLKMIKENYGSESAMIRSMLRDYSAPEFVPMLAAVSGSGEVLAELNTAHAAFEQARIAYESSKAEEGMYENASKMKKPVLDIINKSLVVYLKAMVQVNPKKYEVFVRQVAQIIADTNQRVNNRSQKPQGPEAPAAE